jgi:hypothetical protein
MARIANKTTFGIERIRNVEGDIEIRRKVVAGQPIPESIEVDPSVIQEVDDVAGPHYRASQILGTKESDEALKHGVHRTAEDVVPSETPRRRGRGRPAKTGESEAADDFNEREVQKTRSDKTPDKADKKAEKEGDE